MVESVDEMQIDFHAYLETYNTQRPHQRNNVHSQVFRQPLPRSGKRAANKAP